MNITLKQFNKLLETVNHRLTKLESDMRWVKWVMSYVATLLTLVTVAGFI